MAKPAGGTYEPNKRVMLKVKHERDCDCVVAGFRWHKRGEGTAVGSLLLGLYDDAGKLQHVGVCASFTAGTAASCSSCWRPIARTRWLITPGRTGRDMQQAAAPRPAAAAHAAAARAAGARARTCPGSRCAPELVVEVAYDHMQGARFRHTAQFRRWRTDKKPADCTYAQLEVVAAARAGGDLRHGPLVCCLHARRTDSILHMALIDGHHVGILACNLQPGDIVLKLNQKANLGAGWNKWGNRSVIGNLISGFSAFNPEYVHGGLSVGQGRLIEVNGGIGPDDINGNRLTANIYLTDVKRDLGKDSYDVWRCNDSALAEEVARQAYPFVPIGVNKSWSYNIRDAARSVGLNLAAKIVGHGPLDSTSGHQKEGPLPKDASAVDIAIWEKRRFYCTQFVVWLYNVVSSRILDRGRGAILMSDQEAYPGYLAEVLHKRSSNFSYLGAIRGHR